MSQARGLGKSGAVVMCLCSDACKLCRTDVSYRCPSTIGPLLPMINPPPARGREVLCSNEHLVFGPYFSGGNLSGRWTPGIWRRALLSLSQGVRVYEVQPTTNSVIGEYQHPAPGTYCGPTPCHIGAQKICGASGWYEEDQAADLFLWATFLSLGEEEGAGACLLC